MALETGNTLKKHKNNSIKGRSLARLMAIQIFFQYDFYEKTRDIQILKEELLNNYLLDGNNEEPSSYVGKFDSKLLDNLISGTILALPKIDEEIISFLKGEWKIEELPDVMLELLRLAVFELKFMKNIPTKVVISEYVDIAGCYYPAQKVTFVNGILENIAQKNRTEIKEEKND